MLGWKSAGRAHRTSWQSRLQATKKRCLSFSRSRPRRCVPLGANVGEGGPHSQARMVGEEIFSATQGPENLQNRRHPRESLRLVIGRITRCQPMSDAGERLAEERKGRLGGVQTARPTTERGGIGHTVRVFQRRRRLFPATMLHKAPPQSLTARQQAVMRVRERKKREKGEGLPASVAAAATDGNPVMMLIVCLLA